MIVVVATGEEPTAFTAATPTTYWPSGKPPPREISTPGVVGPTCASNSPSRKIAYPLIGWVPTTEGAVHQACSVPVTGS